MEPVKGKIIDAHQHLWAVQHPETYGANTVDLLLRRMDENGIDHGWISTCTYEPSPRGMRMGNQATVAALKAHPDRILGMGYVRLGEDGPDAVRALKDAGCFGLKVICPLGPYDSPAFDPVWETAAELKMPVTFHTGEINTGERRTSPLDMMPDRLFRIASCFPNLIIIAAHMGVTRSQDAISLVGRHKNAYMDCAGAYTLKSMPKLYFDLKVYWDKARKKILFGCDQLYDGIADEVNHTQDFMREIKLSPEEAEATWWKNASDIESRCR